MSTSIPEHPSLDDETDNTRLQPYSVDDPTALATRLKESILNAKCELTRQEQTAHFKHVKRGIDDLVQFWTLEPSAGHIHVKEHRGVSSEHKTMILNYFKDGEERLEMGANSLANCLEHWKACQSKIGGDSAILEDEAHEKATRQSILSEFSNRQAASLRLYSDWDQNATTKSKIKDVHLHSPESLATYMSNLDKVQSWMESDISNMKQYMAIVKGYREQAEQRIKDEDLAESGESKGGEKSNVDGSRVTRHPSGGNFGSTLTVPGRS